VRPLFMDFASITHTKAEAQRLAAKLFPGDHVGSILWCYAHQTAPKVVTFGIHDPLALALALRALSAAGGKEMVLNNPSALPFNSLALSLPLSVKLPVIVMKNCGKFWPIVANSA